MPQAKRGGSSSKTSASRSGTAKRSSSGSARGGSRASGSRASGTRAAGSRASGSRTAGSSGSSSSRSTRSASAAGAGTSDPRVEAVAERIRKLNERIIEASKGAGEVTLTSYERALKTIASSLERGPGSSDVEWISNLATVQAKFIRDVTAAWTSAAREMMK